MQQKQQTIYQIKNSIFRESNRPSDDPSIILANRRNVHMNYVKCNAILWDEQMDKVSGPIAQVYHRVVVHEPCIKASTSLPLKRDKLADSRTTFITTHDNLTYQNEYKGEGNDSFRTVKKLAKSNVIFQSQNSKQQNQRTEKKKSLFDSSKKQMSASHYSDYPQQHNRQYGYVKAAEQKTKKIPTYSQKLSNQGHFTLLGNKGIREVQELDLSAEQIQNQEKLDKLRRQYQEMQKIAEKKRKQRITLNDEILNTQQTTKKQNQRHYTSYSNESPYNSYLIRTQQTPRFEKNHGRRITFTENHIQNHENYSIDSSKEFFLRKNQNSTQISPFKNELWSSQILQNQKYKSNLQNINEYYSGSAKKQSEIQDDRLSVNSRSSNHVVIKSTCSIYDLKKEEGNKSIDVKDIQANKITFNNNHSSNNVIKMTREQYQQYKRNKQLQEDKKNKVQNQLDQNKRNIQIKTPQWGNNFQSNFLEQTNTDAFFYPQRQVVKRRRLSLTNNAQNKDENKQIIGTKNNYQELFEQPTLFTKNSFSKDAIEGTNTTKNPFFSNEHVAMDRKSQLRMSHCPSNPNMQQYDQQNNQIFKHPSTAREHRQQSRNIEDVNFYKQQLVKALRREQQLIDLFMKEQKKTQNMEKKIKQLEQTLSNSSVSQTKKSTDKYEVDQSLLLTTHLMIMMVDDQKRKLNNN